MISDASSSAGPRALETYLDSLQAADWTQPDGPVQLSAKLTLNELAHLDFFTNTRIFLHALAQSNLPNATATGNLDRAFVAQMFDRLELTPKLRDSIRQVCKVLNEMDLWPLHIIRIVTQCAGLITRRKDRFTLTQSGRALLPDDQAGALFQKLFIAYFQRFDLSYLCPSRHVPGIQQTIAIILWRLEIVGRDWQPVKGLATHILPAEVLDELRQTMVSPYEEEEWILTAYVLQPLLELGLIEQKQISREHFIDKKDFIRTTPLWKKFTYFPPPSKPRP
jgi:hypothetical protein